MTGILRRRRRPDLQRRPFPALVVLAAITLTGCGGATVSAPTSPTPIVGVAGGRTVYSDDFTDARSGWFSGQTAAGASFTYRRSAYVVTSHHNAVNYTGAHFGQHLQQVAIDVHTLVENGNPATAGAGAWFFQGDGPPRTDVYMVVISPSQTFEIRRYNDAATPGIVLQVGRTPLIKPMGEANDIVAACRTVRWEGNTARNEVVLTVGGATVADVFDTWPAQQHRGWGTGLLTSGDDHIATTVQFTHFRVRDLGGGA